MPLDNDLQLLPRLRDRLRDYRPAPDQVDAAVLIPVTESPTPELILTRRAGHLSSHAGEVAFPGGKRDPGDATIIATALRESHEEIGLEARHVEVVGELDVFVSRVGLRVQPIVGMVDRAAALVPSPDEIESIFHVPLEYFLTEKPAYTHRFRFMGQEVTVPSFNYGDYVIWGLTAFMIVDLVQRVYDHEIEFHWPAALAAPLAGNDR